MCIRDRYYIMSLKNTLLNHMLRETQPRSKTRSLLNKLYSALTLIDRIWVQDATPMAWGSKNRSKPSSKCDAFIRKSSQTFAFVSARESPLQTNRATEEKENKQPAQKSRSVSPQMRISSPAPEFASVPLISPAMGYLASALETGMASAKMQSYLKVIKAERSTLKSLSKQKFNRFDLPLKLPEPKMVTLPSSEHSKPQVKLIKLTETLQDTSATSQLEDVSETRVTRPKAATVGRSSESEITVLNLPQRISEPARSPPKQQRMFSIKAQAEGVKKKLDRLEKILLRPEKIDRDPLMMPRQVISSLTRNSSANYSSAPLFKTSMTMPPFISYSPIHSRSGSVRMTAPESNSLLAGRLSTIEDSILQDNVSFLSRMPPVEQSVLVNFEGESLLEEIGEVERMGSTTLTGFQVGEPHVEKTNPGEASKVWTVERRDCQCSFREESEHQGEGQAYEDERENGE
eukprot:TRINITY_DN7131_c0_g1_i2.p1 TRINITY_DN7131_c0_g1~~TRINITY_DN7131_c0_g1_i2.p1  ORF type:complete len:480 (-),score=45.84 TRINITY_DN7131_c0_g1_i2:122-1501(-)